MAIDTKPEAASPANANSSLLGERWRNNGSHFEKFREEAGPTLLERINELIEQHGHAIAQLSKLKEAQPDYILRMRVRELQALAYLESPF